MTVFAIVKSNDDPNIANLIDELSNGRGISLFFLGIGDSITKYGRQHSDLKYLLKL